MWDDGSCDNAFGDPQVNKQKGGTFQSPVHHYHIERPAAGGGITLRRTPTATAGAMAVYYYGFCSVAYHAGVTPVTLSVDGTSLIAGDLKTLIGRGQTGRIEANGYDLKNHNWTVSGPQLFDHVGNQLHTYEPFVGAHIDPTVSFYASKDGSETVSCTCDVYVGSTNIGSVSGMLTVAVVRPTYSIAIFPVAGSYTGYSGTNMNPGEVTSGLSTQLPAGGMEFDFTAANPPEFPSDAGTAALCQLIDENTVVDPDVHIVTNGYWLDGSFPYSNRVINVTSTNGQMSDYDTPFEGLGSNQTGFNINTQFATTEIYRPSGGVYVPLRTKRWSWITTGYQSNGVWSNPTGGLAVSAGQADFDLTKATWYHIR